MKLASAIVTSVLLALFIAMGYIGFGISRQLTVPVQLALGLALLLDVAALLYNRQADSARVKRAQQRIQTERACRLAIHVILGDR